MSVSALPMSIWPHAMSYFRPSRAADLVSPVIACFVAVYGAEFGRGVCAEIDPLLMIRPPRGSWSFMRRNASRVQRNAPVRLTSTTRRHSSNVRSSSGTAGAPVPALLNRRSRRPKACFVVSKRPRTESGSVTSVGTARARGPSGPARATVSASASGRRPASTTEYPSPRRARAVARPIPDPAPVTIAVLRKEFIARYLG